MKQRVLQYHKKDAKGGDKEEEEKSVQAGNQKAPEIGAKLKPGVVPLARDDKKAGAAKPRGRIPFGEKTGKAERVASNASSAPEAKGLWWRFKWKLKWPICQFLDQSPMTFKELYVAIAQHHPKHCPGIANGKILNPANVGWLHKLERDLQNVANNLDGVWHLKQGISDFQAP